MVWKLAGVDENGNFTPRVETAFAGKIKTEVSTAGKDARTELDKIYAPKSGSTAYASLGADGKVLANQLPPAQAQSPTLRTAYVNFPPIWEKLGTIANGWRTQGVLFAATMSGTVSRFRAKLNTTAGVTYTLGIYEVSRTDIATVTAVVGQATFTETADQASKIIDIAGNAPIVAGKYYVLAISSSATLTVYYSNAGGLYHSAVSSTVWEGSVDPQRTFNGIPVVGSTFGKGSDYAAVGMSVDF